MKKQTIITIALALFASSLTAAEPGSLTRLKEQRTAKLRAAMNPIEAEYQQKLKALYEALAKAGNVEAAELVAKAMLETSTGDDLRKWIVGTRWKWEEEIVEFKDGGIAKKSNAKEDLSWKVVRGVLCWGKAVRVCKFEPARMWFQDDDGRTWMRVSS